MTLTDIEHANRIRKASRDLEDALNAAIDAGLHLNGGIDPPGGMAAWRRFTDPDPNKHWRIGFVVRRCTAL